MPNPSRDLADELQPAAAGTDSRLLLLAEADNVLVARMRIRAGEAILVEGAGVTLAADLPLGHKLARRAITAGDKILKYGAPIGTATEAIAAGTPVHVHNVRSDYTPTYHLMDAAKGGATS
ncbi:MAG: UxaA family hydrolase [Candidatus Kaistia colombiensis]|nr:MAG: UxaA family hydrolase [Kaistia sp.]